MPVGIPFPLALEMQSQSDQENTCPSIKQLPKDTDRLLTNSEKKGMTCEEKAKYNTKKKMITTEILKEWPESNPIPTFTSNNTNEIRQLQQFQERLGDDEKYIYPEWSLGKNAIKEMAERTGKVKNANIYHSGYTTTESETSSCDSPPSTLSSSPELDSKRKLWKDYFNQGQH
ncbi:hypothetical protein AC249_AIPGENE7368 [Exaiptasia diaphana]|nr:hypothetical protein AC249_AIPGENE7368 [Exaiptasia diaphana]